MTMKIRGIGRLANNERAIILYFDRSLTDDEMRIVHDEGFGVAEAEAAERERCARKCDHLAATVLEKVIGREHQIWAFKRAAAAIRSE